ncbi:MAG: hypothetical protein IT559_04835 [Alphaproteobacteria bacterium]|nr:hypothetical protein [Alphaproteobacteria bacterium]
MPMCTDEALAAQAGIPCADHADHHGDKKEGKSNKLTFMSDCAGVDMQKADTASYDKPDIKKDLIVYPLVADIAVSRFLPTDVGTIRGPPPDWPAFSQTQPSILLTTQRLRI